MAIPGPNDEHDREAVLAKRDGYDEIVQRFTFLRDSIEGTGGYADYMGRYWSDSGVRMDEMPTYTYLRRHPRESDSRWLRRRETAYYVNFVAWILGVALGLLTRETPGRENYPDPLKKWMDKAGFEDLRALLFWWSLGYGELYAVVDRPKRTDDAASAAGVNDAGSYVRMIHPDCVWDLEMEGEELAWLKYAQDIKEKPGPLEKRRSGKLVWVLTKEGWWNYKLWNEEKKDKGIRVNDSGVWEGHVAGRVPVAVFTSRREAVGGIKRAPAFIEAPARIMKRLHNVTSFKGQTQDSSCVPFFIVPVKDREELVSLKIGSSSAIPDDPMSSKSAHFAAYDTGPIELLSAEQDRLVLLMKQVCSLAFDENAAATGIAKSYAFLQLNVTLASQVTALEAFELAILDLVERFEGREGMPEDAKVAMSRRFDIADAQAEIEQGVQLLQAEYGPLARKEIKRKMLLQRYLQDIDGETKKDLETELEDESTMDADDGPPTNPPPEQPPGGLETPQQPAPPARFLAPR